MEYYALEKAPLEYADILKDLAFAFVSLARVQDKEESCKTALKAYKKAFKIYCEISTRIMPTAIRGLQRPGNWLKIVIDRWRPARGILKAAKRE